MQRPIILAAVLLLAACGGEPENHCDLDGDGYDSAECGGDDCDDAASETYPGAEELCDGLDNDCDGSIQGVTDWDGSEEDDEVDRDLDGWLNCDDCAITAGEVGGPRAEVCPDA